jgi:hypothetical protein
MKKFFFISLSLVVLLAVFSYRNNTNYQAIVGKISKKGCISADNLRYRIYAFGILPVGEAVFTNRGVEDYQGKKVYHLTAVASSLKLFSGFFKGSAMLDSYVDIKKVSPLLFIERLSISGRSDFKKEVFYDQDNLIMSILGDRRQILPDTHDPISAMFKLRTIDFDRVKDLEMNINTNQKNYLLSATAEQKKFSIAKNAYSVTIAKADIRRRDKNNPYHRSKITMVLLKCDENVPVLIKVFASGMSLDIKLIDIK